jgi:hypothetical protein
MLNKTEDYATGDRKGRANQPLIHKHALSNARREDRRAGSPLIPADTGEKDKLDQVPCRDCASQLATRA